MTTQTLKNVLISKNMLDRYFENEVPQDLWRALKKKETAGIFDFVEEPFVMSNGRPRPADITIRKNKGEDWVFIKNRPRGVSTFDKKGVPSGKSWEYFKIPKGITLPEGLAIVKDEFNEKFEATHYTIAPTHDMPLQQFKDRLSTLARKLIKEVA